MRRGGIANPEVVVAGARACIAANRAILSASRYRIAASRRWLNRYFDVSGGAAPPVQETVRAMIARGALFAINGHRIVVYAGAGSGLKSCRVCDGRIAPSDLEYNVLGDGTEERTVPCHFECFEVWRAESRDVAP